MGVGEYREYSVLMSVYHKEKPEYLKQAIESIQAQTRLTDDFVLVCDGPLNDALDDVITKKQQEMGTTLNPADEGKHPGHRAGADYGGKDGEGCGEVGVRILFMPESTEGVAVGATTAMDYENAAESTENDAETVTK